MFNAAVLTTWVEALQLLFDTNYPVEKLRDLNVLTEYPMEEVNYPGLWLNFSVNGDVQNVGIGHIEIVENDDDTLRKVYRWQFQGTIEITVGAMGNLERALIVDEVSKAIAVARIGENAEGVLRNHVENGDLVGQTVVWESFAITGWATTPGTPWGTDDVIYEATIVLSLRGEVVLDPVTGNLVPLTAIIIREPLSEGDPDVPVVGQDGWV